MARHLLQSHAWEKYAQSEGQPTFWIDGGGYEVLAILHSTPLGKYLFCPYGPHLKDIDVAALNKNTQPNKDTENHKLTESAKTSKHNKPEQALQNAISGLRSLAQEQGAFFIRIEPTVYFSPEQMRRLDFVKSHDLEPAHTWTIDLTQSQDDILNAVEKTKVRHWRNHEKKGISLRTTQDPLEINILSQLLQGVGARDNFTPQDESHLQGQLAAGFATLYIAEYEQQPIAAALVYDYDGVRYYAHAATDDEHRKLMAGTVLLVQMILDAKEQGAQTFDFWGITTSSDKSHPWYGFTQYKKSFGGKQLDYTGTWDLPLHKFRYQLYKILRQVNRAKRKH